MISDRPYRKAMNIAGAKGEIQKGSGSQFDPGVVEGLLRIKDKALSTDAQNVFREKALHLAAAG